MTTFHITRGGRGAPCEATVRACPLGEHYPSLRAAVRAALVRDLATMRPSSSVSLPDGHGADGLPDGRTASPLTPQPVVEFGKYRGQPLSSLLDDPAYCHWLLTQSWFQREYPDVYRVLRERREVARLRNEFYRL